MKYYDSTFTDLIKKLMSCNFFVVTPTNAKSLFALIEMARMKDQPLRGKLGAYKKIIFHRNRRKPPKTRLI